MKRILPIILFSLLTVSLSAQSRDSVEMQFAMGVHRDASFVYTYKPPYLIRHTEISPY